MIEKRMKVVYLLYVITALTVMSMLAMRQPTRWFFGCEPKSTVGHVDYPEDTSPASDFGRAIVGPLKAYLWFAGVDVDFYRDSPPLEGGRGGFVQLLTFAGLAIGVVAFLAFAAIYLSILVWHLLEALDCIDDLRGSAKPTTDN